MPEMTIAFFQNNTNTGRTTATLTQTLRLKHFWPHFEDGKRTEMTQKASHQRDFWFCNPPLAWFLFFFFFGPLWHNATTLRAFSYLGFPRILAKSWRFGMLSSRSQPPATSHHLSRWQGAPFCRLLSFIKTTLKKFSGAKGPKWRKGG